MPPFQWGRKISEDFMLKINITQLITAVQDAAPFAAPEMSDGTSYLFDSVYTCLSKGKDVRLSELVSFAR